MTSKLRNEQADEWRMLGMNKKPRMAVDALLAFCPCPWVTWANMQPIRSSGRIIDWDLIERQLKEAEQFLLLIEYGEEGRMKIYHRPLGICFFFKQYVSCAARILGIWYMYATSSNWLGRRERIEKNNCKLKLEHGGNPHFHTGISNIYLTC
jgi:hypothetical protein